MHAVLREWPWVVVAIAIAMAAAAMDPVAGEELTLLRRGLFAPGVIGHLLVGGVHGDASAWLQLAAWAAAVGLFWTLLVRLVVAISRRFARQGRSKRT